MARIDKVPSLAACAIIPVYNHSAYLRTVVEQLLGVGLPVILIDDGSTKDCHRLMQVLANEFEKVQLTSHPVNAGKGAAIKTGLRLAGEYGFAHALQVDADGQHNLDDIPRFLDAMHREPTALIAGYPEYDQSVPKHRYYGRYATHIWVWINTLSTAIVDSMCGFRVYPVKASIALLDNSRIGDRMDFDGEFIVRWFWRGWPLTQLRTRVIYPEQGTSHFRLVADNVLISRMHARLFFGMLIRLPVLLYRKYAGRRQRP